MKLLFNGCMGEIERYSLQNTGAINEKRLKHKLLKGRAAAKNPSTALAERPWHAPIPQIATNRRLNLTDYDCPG